MAYTEEDLALIVDGLKRSEFIALPVDMSFAQIFSITASLFGLWALRVISGRSRSE